MQSKTGTADGGTSATASTADVVECVARTKDVDVLALGPIYDVVDPGALDALLETSTAAVEVTFEYEGQVVTVHGDGRIHVD